MEFAKTEQSRIVKTMAVYIFRYFRLLTRDAVSGPLLTILVYRWSDIPVSHQCLCCTNSGTLYVMGNVIF
jgi:hypothetical protein